MQFSVKCFGRRQKALFRFSQRYRNNQFFIKLFKRQNNFFHRKKCLRCSDFLPSSRFKVNDDFLLHYDAGRNAFEEKPVSYTNFSEIRKYEITFAQHSHDYDFYNAEKLVDEFLLNVKNKIGSLITIFSLNVVFLWKIYNRLPLKTNSRLKILDIDPQNRIKLSCLMILFILI